MGTTPRLPQMFRARILGALASCYRFAFACIKGIVEFFGLEFACIKATVESFALFVTALVVVFVHVYSYVKFSRDALIIDSFSVPKQFEEAGFTPDRKSTR